MADYLKLNDTLGCERYPEKFMIPLESGGAIFAYDPATFLSANLTRRSCRIRSGTSGARFPLKYNLTSGDFGYFGIPLNVSGPCGLLLLKFRDFKKLRTEAWVLIIGMLLLAFSPSRWWAFLVAQARHAACSHLDSYHEYDG